MNVINIPIAFVFIILSSYAMEDNSNNINYEKRIVKRDLQVIASTSGNSHDVLRRINSLTDVSVVEPSRILRARSVSPQICKSPTMSPKMNTNKKK